MKLSKLSTGFDYIFSVLRAFRGKSIGADRDLFMYETELRGMSRIIKLSLVNMKYFQLTW